MITSGFFNALMKDGEPDRKYNAEQMSEYFDGLVSNGVYESIGGAMRVKAGGGMVVQVQTGRALVDCHWIKNDSIFNITLAPAHVTLNRYTNIVIRLDYAARAASIIAVDGENATKPVRPQVTRTQTIKDLLLATVYIAKGATSITQSAITDMRANSSVCGWVTGLVKQVDTSDLFVQWQTAYEEFYADMQMWKDEQKKAFDLWMTDLSGALRVDTYVEKYQNTVSVSGGTLEVEVGIPEYDYKSDILLVFTDGIVMNADSEYSILQESGITKVRFTYARSAGTVITFIAIKSKIGYNSNQSSGGATGGQTGVLFGASSTSAGYHLLTSTSQSLSLWPPSDFQLNSGGAISTIINLQIICINRENLNEDYRGGNLSVALDIVNIPIVNAAFLGYEATAYELRNFYPTITRNSYPLYAVVHDNNEITISLHEADASVAIFAVLYDIASL